MGTAISAVIGVGYGRGAYAQALSGSNSSKIELSGPGSFETQDGFSVDINAAETDAITIRTEDGEDGDTTFIDEQASSIIGTKRGIYADNDGSGALGSGLIANR